MAMDLTDLFKKQAELDETIAKNHNVTYASTRSRRIMALIVEIGELANATRCFKYWSNKGSESKEIVLDEYADGLHFFLSLGVDIKTSKTSYNRTKHLEDLTAQFHEIYHRIDIFNKKQDEASYIKAFQSFLNLLPLLGYRWKDLENAYYKKLGVNYVRQQTNYQLIETNQQDNVNHNFLKLIRFLLHQSIFLNAYIYNVNSRWQNKYEIKEIFHEKVS